MSQANLHQLIDNLSLSYHLENTPFGVILWDDQLNLVYCSKTAAALFDCSPEDVMQASIEFERIVHKDDNEIVAKQINEIMSGRSTHNQSMNRNVTKQGRIIYCQWYNSALKNEAGKLINILSLFQDITPQVETQEALQQSEQRLSTVFNSAIDPMWLIRVEGPDQYRFETINIAFTNVTGWRPDEVQGQPMENIIPPPSHNLVRQKYAEAIRTGHIVDYVEESAHPSGIKYGEIRVIPIPGEGGKVERLLGIANDITDKVYLQQKLDAEREARTRHITSAAIKGQEAERAKVSRELHDNVNQVLTTVKLYIELCLDGKADPAAILPKCVGHLTDTINEIRTLSKQLSAPSLGNMEFRETLLDLVESVRAAALMEVELTTKDLPFTEMENELHLTLYRVAQEQLTNIVKYANAKKVSISLLLTNSVLQFIIADDGVGFDPSQKRRGIGITNMQSRVEIVGGSFALHSSAGNGTTVSLQIPVTVDDNVCYAAQTIRNLSV
jgi:PAS domain S-box-containing protein